MRVKCPRERRCVKSECQRQGCTHFCSAGSRICGCCLAQLGPNEPARFSLMREYAAEYDYHRAEEVALDKLNAMPPRRPIGRGWPGSPNKRWVA